MSDKYPFTLIKQEIAKRQGEALDFAVGSSPFPLSPEMSAWLKANSELGLAPGNSDDILAFASAASTYLKKQYGLDVSPALILPTAGGRAAMGILAACTLTPDDTVIVTEPGYPAFARLAAQRGATVTVSRLDPDNEFAPDFEYSDDVRRGSVTMLAVNYPNNPTGSTLSSAVLDKLRDLASPGMTLFNDATYGPLVYNDEPRALMSTTFSAKSTPNIVELHSFSKLYPIGPLAVSFLTGSAALIDPMSTYSEYAWSPLSRLQLAATAKCLQDNDRIKRFREHIPKQLESLTSGLEHLGFVAHRSNSGTYLVCDVPKSIGGEPVSSAQNAAKLLMDKFNIAVVPLGTHDHAYLRFSALYRSKDLERLVDLKSKLEVR
jgi:aspartate/methionine/tyrosine aminotransferase